MDYRTFSRAVRAISSAFAGGFVLALLLMAGRHANATCQVVAVAGLSTDPGPPNLTARISYTAAPSAGATVASEGLAERLSDVLIYDSGVGAACFQNNNLITLTYSAPLLAAPGVDIFDSAGAAGLSAVIRTTAGAPPIVTLTVSHAGTAGDLVHTAVGAAIRIKGARADTSSSGGARNIYVLPSASASGTVVRFPTNIGSFAQTIAVGASIHAGAGLQHAGGTLATPATVTFTENFSNAFRVAGSEAVYGVSPPSATSLVFDLGNNIPVGVTVTFPAQLVNAGFTFNLRRGGGTCAGPVQCFAVYDTAANAASTGSLTVTTAAVARTGADGSTPAIGVQIAAVSGMGTVPLRVLFGPGVSGSGNDDVNPGAIPRYVGTTTAGSAPTRAIVSGDWFRVAPGTALLSLAPSTIAFGGVVAGTASERLLLITNISPTRDLQIASIAASGRGFALLNSCPAIIAPLNGCQLRVQFAPASGESLSGFITIVSDAAGSPHTVNLTGEGIVMSPVPALTSIAPNAIFAGSGNTRLLLSGWNFFPGSLVQWDGAGVGTTFISETQIAAAVPASNLAAIATAQITVLNPSPGGGVSNALPVSVIAGPLPAKPYLYFVAHVVNGGGFVTRITAVDLSGRANSTVLNYVSQSGELLSSSSQKISPGGAMRFATGDPTTPLATTWAIAGADAPLALQVVVETIGASGEPLVSNSFGFSACTPAGNFTIPAAFDPPSAALPYGRTMGIALANPAATAVSVTLVLVNQAGNSMTQQVISLPPFGQIAVDLQSLDRFKAELPAGSFVGSVTGSARTAVCTMALLDDNGSYVVSPVTSAVK